MSGNGGAKVAVVFTEFYSSARASGSVQCPVHALVGVRYMPSLVSGTSVRPDVTLSGRRDGKIQEITK